MSPRELLREVADRVFNGRDLDAIDELFTDDYVLHDPTVGDEIHGPDGFRRYVASFHEAFSDLHVEQLDHVAEGDKIATRFVIRGTHDGPLLGVSPTGRRVETHGTSSAASPATPSPRSGLWWTCTGCCARWAP